MSEERSKLKIIVWIVLAMVGETVIVLLPIACVISREGFLEIFSATDGMLDKPTYELWAGIVLGLFFGLSYGFKYGFFRGIAIGLFAGIVLGLIYGLVLGFLKEPSVGFRGGLSVLIGSLLGVLLMQGLRNIPEGFTTTFIGFLRPLQLKTYSLKKATASFVIVYMLVVIVFALWFNACYLESPEEYFDIGDKIKTPNLWDFIYFSFVTITTLGYGDISPLHTFPQALVIVETMTGLGLIAGYLGIIVHVGGQKAQQKADDS